MRWIPFRSIAAVCLCAGVSLPAPPAADEVSWFFGDFDAALRLAERRNTNVLVYFWMPTSDTCGQMYTDTIQTSAAAAAMEPFVCVSASHGEDTGAALFERYSVQTVPAFLLVSPTGRPEDGFSGFADVATLSAQLERMASGLGTLSDLERQADAQPEDMALRNLVAGKLLDLGDQDAHDAVQDSIRRDDPRGESLVAARLHFSQLVNDVLSAARTPEELDLAPADEFAQAALHDSIAFGTWNWKARMENLRGDREGESAAVLRAYGSLPETRVLSWGSGMAELFWGNRELITDDEKEMALDLATRAFERAELVVEEGNDGYGNTLGSADPDEYLATFANILGKAHYMAGQKDEAVAALELAVALVEDEPEYAERLEAYRRGRADDGFGVRADTHPVWSPNGKKIAFASDRRVDQDVWVVDLRSGKETRLTALRGDEIPFSWSRKAIAFDANGFRNSGIYQMKPNGSKVEMLVPFEADGASGLFSPVFSPDGKRVAFATTVNGKMEIAVASVGKGEVEILTGDTPKTDMQPTWSPDGDSLLFMSNRIGDSDVYSIDLDEGTEVNVTNAPENSWDMDPEYSPDGESIVFSSWRSGQLEVWVMAADGSGARSLTNSATEDRHPRWSPDGKRIAFERKQADGNVRIWVMESDGRDPRPVLEP